MKLLITRLAGGLLGRSGSGSGTINRRRCSIDLVPSSRHMVTAVTCRTETNPTGQAPAPAPSAEDDSRWLLLNSLGCHGDSTAANVVPDDKTAAECRTSWGRPLRVSLGRAEPPAISYVCFNRYAGASDSNSDGEEDLSCYSDDDILYVVAAHSDSVLLKMSLPQPPGPITSCTGPQQPPSRRGPSAAQTDYFLYRTTAAGQPPSLSLLPKCDIAMHVDHEGEGGPYAGRRVFSVMDTSILRYGGDKDDDRGVLVSQLRVAHKAPFDSAEICVLRPGRRCWELKEAVPIVHNEGGGRYDLRSWLGLNDVIPVGNRFLCGVNYDRSTLLVCDMAEENPKLRYMPLPMPKAKWDEVDLDDERIMKPLSWLYHRSIGASTTSAAAPVVRFVSIDNCCCGAPLRASVCNDYRSSFVVTAWSMALNTTGEPLEWVKDGVLEYEEIWEELRWAGYDDGFHYDIPRRVEVYCPIVSSENPDIICFMAQDIDSETLQTYGNEKTWTLQFDMRSKKLTSAVSPCNRNADPNPIQWDVCVNYGAANHYAETR